MPNKFDWQKTLRMTADLSDAEFRVLIMLSTYTDGQMVNAHPGLARLAADCCLSEKWTKKCLSSLTNKHYIELQEEGGNKHGKGRTNVYRVVPRLSTRGEPGYPLATIEGGNSAAGKGGTQRPGRGEPSYPPSGSSSGQDQRARDRGARAAVDCAVCGRPQWLCQAAEAKAESDAAHEFRPARSSTTSGDAA